MSANIVALVQGVYAAAALTTVFTAPSGRGVRMEKVTATNQSGSAVALTLSIVPAAASVGNEHRVIVTESIQAGKTRDFSEFRHALQPGDTVRALAGTASAISLFISGTAFT